MNVQLTDVLKEQLLWAETYDRELKSENIFEIQSELAEKIMEALRAHYTSGEKERVQKKSTENLAAYHLYVQGRAHLSQRTEKEMRQALTYFQQAIQKDSAYGLAWSGLAETLGLMKFYKYPVPEDVSDAVTAAEKALELDSELAESHTARGVLHACHQNGPEAIEKLEEAVELKPSYAEAHCWLAWMYMLVGQLEDALEPAERALELNPMAPYVRVYSGIIYLADKRYEKALKVVKKVRKLQYNLAVNHLVEGLALYHMEQYSGALFALEEAAALSGKHGVPSESMAWCTLAVVHAAGNNISEAENLLDRIRQTTDYFSEGLVQAGIGNTSEALRLLENVTNWNHLTTVYFRYLFPTILEPVRNSDRYKRIYEQVNKSWGI